ncbi:MAG: MmgE/PrpD family protein [Yoonia sp.]|nr:MmgE/PrpD family protein [Yoonia sp.]
MTDAISFVTGLKWADVPKPVKARVKMALLDVIGVGAGGAGFRAARISQGFARDHLGGAAPLLFAEGHASPAGAAFASGMSIDALDAHDGFNPAKGHIGATLFSSLWPYMAGLQGEAFLTALVAGYEFGARAAMAQHGTVPDYHTSGSWGAVTGAAILARLWGLDHETARHAIGIAEYHGPRSQMMRDIDHPTMLKDGTGWGAMTAVSSALLAQAGFTGAPAISVEQAPTYWADMGERWFTLEQYFKPYPVCRWAQAPIEGVLALRRLHGLAATDVAGIHVATFHESIRLATNNPKATDEAQYSTSFPCAVAMVRGDVRPADIDDDALGDPEIVRLSNALTMSETAEANAVFPLTRLAKATLTLKDGRELSSDWMQPRWDHTAPPTQAEITAKFHAYADEPLGTERALAIRDAVETLEDTSTDRLVALLSQPIKRRTSGSSSE